MSSLWNSSTTNAVIEISLSATPPSNHRDRDQNTGYELSPYDCLIARQHLNCCRMVSQAGIIVINIIIILLMIVIKLAYALFIHTWSAGNRQTCTQTKRDALTAYFLLVLARLCNPVGLRFKRHISQVHVTNARLKCDVSLKLRPSSEVMSNPSKCQVIHSITSIFQVLAPWKELAPI